MRLAFVYYFYNDAGSAQDVHHYTRVAEDLGHEVAIYGPRDRGSSFNLSIEIDSADAVVFVFEWTTELRHGDGVDLARLIGRIPRERRIVIDCDGGYNDAICVDDDYNHREPSDSRRWTEVCDSISDKICQPTLHPLRENVRPFFFHGYDPGSEVPVDLPQQDFGIVYVGHSKFRWKPMLRVLEAVAPIRDAIGRIAIVGHGWDDIPAWAAPMGIEDIYRTDPEYLTELGVEIVPPVPFERVIGWMSKGRINPVIYRPLFQHLRLVTCRTFETPAAATLPLFDLDVGYVEEIYGEAARDLVLPQDRPEEKLLDMMGRPAYYRELLAEMRGHLRKHHSYESRLRELVELVEA